MSGYKVSHFSDAFIRTVANYTANGGTVIVCGNQDLNDSTSCQTHTELNKLLSAMGATVSLHSDSVAELNENNTLNYQPVVFGYDAASEWLTGADPELGFSVYNACSVNMSKNAETGKVYKAQPLIWGNAETFSADLKDNNGYEINSDELNYVCKPGNVTEVVVQDTKAGGHIFLAGGVFMSDFSMETDEHDMMLNATLMQNILDNTGVQLPVTPIRTMRRGEMGEVFCIEGWVTNGTDNEFTTFFDTIYVQDKTGGVTVYPYSVDGLKIGTKVQIIGYKDAYQDDVEIQVLKCRILDDQNLNIIEPEELCCAEAMDYSVYGGRLLKTKGTITDVQYLGDTVTQLKLKDDTGIATIFIDGYIYSGTTGQNTLASFCKVGSVVSAVGLCFMHPEAGSDTSTCCFRVRNCDEIVYLGEGDHASVCPSLKFDDLDITKWYHEAIDYMLNNGLMTGTTTTAPFLFKPNAPTTRAMLVTILNSAAGYPTVDIENPFSDVDPNKWYLPYVLWGYDRGVIAGYGNGKFGPDDNVTREQIAVILYSYSQSNGEDVTARADLGSFPDQAKVAGWAREAVEWAVAEGLISGRSNNGVLSLAPQADASRAEIAAILRSYFTR